MSPLLFALYLEPLCLRVLLNPSVRGFRLHQSEVKLLAYADDLSFFCVDKSSIEAVIEDVVFFLRCRECGLTLIRAVVYGLARGAPRLRPAVVFRGELNRVSTYAFMHMNVIHRYWSSRIEDIRRRVTLWHARSLSVFSRAQVCNVFLLTKLLYVLQVMCCPRTNIQTLHRIFAVFIWN